MRKNRSHRHRSWYWKGFNGDSIQATDARLNNPAGLFLDTTGDLYFAEILSHLIRKVDYKTGIITTVAGDGTSGYSGDNGPATNSILHAPFDVCVDFAGDIYIADTGNSRIRKVDKSTGIITTIAGPGNNAHLSYP